MNPKPAERQRNAEPAGDGGALVPGGWKAWLTSLLISFTGTLVGTTLILMPWGAGWDQNFFSGSSRGWYSVWVNPYFRGAVSGLGALNLWIALADLVKMGRKLK